MSTTSTRLPALQVLLRAFLFLWFVFFGSSSSSSVMAVQPRISDALDITTNHPEVSPETRTRQEAAAVVNLTIWTTPIHEWQTSLVLSVKDIVLRLGGEQRLVFDPEMLVRNGTRDCAQEEKTSTPPDKSCTQNCLSRGRYAYCAVPLDDADVEAAYKAELHVSGSQIVLESARRQCIWRLYGRGEIESQSQSSKSRPDLYFSYLEQVASSSSGCDNEWTTECLQGIYDNLNMSGDDIDACVYHRGQNLSSTTSSPSTTDEGEDKNKANALLDHQIQRAEELQLLGLGAAVPQVIVNGVAMEESSDWTVKGILQAICDAYPQGTAPEACTICLAEKCVDEISACLQDASNSCPEDSSEVAENVGAEFGQGDDAVTENTTTIHTLQPVIHNEDMPKSAPPTTGFDRLTALLSKGGLDTYEMLEHCGVNMHAPMPVVNSILTGNLEGLESGAEQCEGDNVHDFEKVLRSFEQHAGFDLMGWAQKNSVAFGSAISGCMKAFSNRTETTTDEMILNECADLFTDNDALARSLGSFLQWNTIMCPSLPTLQKDVPPCVFQRPGSTVALDGPLIQLSACLFGEVCSHLDSLCEAEVANLNQCLPSRNDETKSCSAIEETCKQQGAILFTSPPPLFGATFPDRCQLFTVDRDEYMHARIVERYNAYRRPCIMDVDMGAASIKQFGDPDEHPAKSMSEAQSIPDGEESQFLHHRWYNDNGQNTFIEVLTHDPLALASAVAFLICFILLCIVCVRICRNQKMKRNYSTLQTEDSDGYYDQEIYRDNFDDEALQPPSWLVT